LGLESKPFHATEWGAIFAHSRKVHSSLTHASQGPA
jgi:hypothetical protein